MLFFWWERVGSNHRRHCQQIYSLPPLATWVHSRIFSYHLDAMYGAGGRTRTPDLLITNQLHYQLCYTSISTTRVILPHPEGFVNLFFCF